MELTGKVPAMLIQLLQEQRSQIKKAGWKDAANYVKNTNKAISEHTLQSLSSQIRENVEWLSKVQAAQNKLVFYQSLYSALPLIPEVTDEIKKTLNSAQSMQEKISTIEELSSNINTPSSKDKIREYIDNKRKDCSSAQRDLIDRKREDCSSAQGDIDKQSRFYTTLELIKSKYADIQQSMEATDDIVAVMNRIPAINRHLSIFLILIKLSNNLTKYNSAKEKSKEIEDDIKKKEKKGEYARKGESVRKQDENERKQKEEQLRSISDTILKNIDDFYQQITRGSEMNLLKELGINLKKDNKGYTPANLLAILITGSKIPVSRFYILLDTAEQIVRRVKRELKKQIKLHKDAIAEYAQKNDTSIAILLLKLEDTEDE